MQFQTFFIFIIWPQNAFFLISHGGFLLSRGGSFCLATQDDVRNPYDIANVRHNLKWFEIFLCLFVSFECFCSLHIRHINSSLITPRFQFDDSILTNINFEGKLLNVREASYNALNKNQEIQNLIKIIGLKQKKDYSDDRAFSNLRYHTFYSKYIYAKTKVWFQYIHIKSFQ